MTSPDVNVGSIIARVGLDTTDLKRGEADSTATLKRTATNLDNTAKAADKVQKNVDKASGAIKRNADTQVDAIRRTRQEESRSARGGVASGALAGTVAGQLLQSGLGNLGDGRGGTRDRVAGIASGAVLGGTIGSVAGPIGTTLGAIAGGGASAISATLGAQARQRAAAHAEAQEWEADHKNRIAQLKREAQFTDDLGRAQLRLQDSVLKVAAARTQLTDPNARAREAGILGGVLGGEFDEHARMTQGDVGKAADKLVAAQERVARAQERVDKITQRTGGGARILSAQASVRQAEDALRTPGGDREAKALRLQAAEARLSDARKAGGNNTRDLAAAERDLDSARRKAEAAEKAAKNAGLPAALDPATLLKRQGVHKGDIQQLDRDTRALVAKGLRAPVIEELLKTEKDAPGTVHKVATSITHAQIVAFNRNQMAMDKAAANLIKAPLDRAYADARRDAERQAKALKAAVDAAMAKAFGGGPVSPNTPSTALLPGTSGDPLYTGLFTTGSMPRQPRPKGAPRGDRDYSVPSITFTGPVTIKTDGDPQGIVPAVASQPHVQALSRG